MSDELAVRTKVATIGYPQVCPCMDVTSNCRYCDYTCFEIPWAIFLVIMTYELPPISFSIGSVWNLY